MTMSKARRKSSQTHGRRRHSTTLLTIPLCHTDRSHSLRSFLFLLDIAKIMNHPTKKTKQTKNRKYFKATKTRQNSKPWELFELAKLTASYPLTCGTSSTMAPSSRCVLMYTMTLTTTARASVAVDICRIFLYIPHFDTPLGRSFPIGACCAGAIGQAHESPQWNY